MSTFVPSVTPPATADPKQRVLYTHGLVLGVDDFVQEQGYFVERNRLHERSMHGYGTVWGLDVRFDQPEIRIAAGLAVDSQGREICVSEAQCGDLANWIAEHADDVRLRFEPRSPPDAWTGKVFVVLCYVECATDGVTVPGAPCRTQSETVVPSRTTESFEVKFSLTPPQQLEEDRIRELGRILSRIRIDAVGAAPVDALVDDVFGRLVGDASSPPVYPSDSPPSSPPDELILAPVDVEAFCRLVIDRWTTEVRPTLQRPCCERTPQPPAGDCVLLAELEVRLRDDLTLVEPPRIDETRRPFVLHVRMLQELLCGLHGGGGAPGSVDKTTGGDLSGTYDAATVVGISGNPVAAGLPASGSILAWDIVAGRWHAAQLGGDARGPWDSLAVRALQGVPIHYPASPVPEGHVLRLRGGSWTAEAWPPTTAVVTPIHELATITPARDRVENQVFELWFHPQSLEHAQPGRRYRINALVRADPAVRVFLEQADADGTRTELVVEDFDLLDHNRIIVTLRKVPAHPTLLFVFDLDRIACVDVNDPGGGPIRLSEAVQTLGLRYIGQDRSIVTIPFRQRGAFN